MDFFELPDEYFGDFDAAEDERAEFAEELGEPPEDSGAGGLSPDWAQAEAALDYYRESGQISDEAIAELRQKWEDWNAEQAWWEAMVVDYDAPEGDT